LKGHGFSRAESFPHCHPEQTRRSEATERAARDLQFSALSSRRMAQLSDRTAALTASLWMAQRFAAAVTVLF